jgi:hypothetical protein
MATKSTQDDQREIQLAHPDADMSRKSWSITSASGRGKVVCRTVGRAKSAGKLVCSFEVEGIAWQRDRALSEASQTTDFRVELPQVVVQTDLLKSLRQRLVEWQSNPAEFVCELCDAAEGDQRLALSIGRDDDLIYSAGKPACILTYACGASMTGRWAFVVDQSCIRLCAESLDQFTLGE